MTPYNVSYEMLHEDVTNYGIYKIPDHLKDSLDFIVGVSRGGLLPAIILSHLYNIPLMPVQYSSQLGNGDKNTHVLIPEFARNTNILLVDDLADSGNTLKELANIFTAKGVNAKTFVIYYKESSVYQPDYFVHRVGADFPWIVFPYEYVYND